MAETSEAPEKRPFFGKTLERREKEEGPIVTIQEGKVRGTFGEDVGGNSFFEFLGIPYAKPPINELRFKAPQPIDPWEGVKDATIVGKSSISRDYPSSPILGSEDCLFLNVYTRHLPSDHLKLRPVMFYIHGGGFIQGSARPGMYGPEFLLSQDIVLVTINYRLGILGFLSIDDPSLGVPGNNGLKDQNLALKWVQRNISSFNGDPNNVTIFGESAGAASVHAHVLSPRSKGLFHKAIIQSGSVLNSWAWGIKNSAAEIVRKMGKVANDEREALEILKTAPAIDIFIAQEKFVETIYAGIRRPFALAIEAPNDDAFLTKSPIEIIREGDYSQVPIIIGYTDTEGMLQEMFKKIDETDGKSDFDWKYLIPVEWEVDNNDDIQEICEKLSNTYKLDEFNYEEMTDSFMLVGLIETLRHTLRTTKSPIYLYRISVCTELNFLKRLFGWFDKPGTCHADELGYLFYSEITPEITPNSVEDQMVKNFVQLWTNFAKFADPTPNDDLKVKWKPITKDTDLNLLDIGEELVVKDIPERKRLEVWWKFLERWSYRRFN